jgi:hypothetical protein
MLRIDIPSTEDITITTWTFNEYSLPKPHNGTANEVNGDLILLFEDEEEAVAYMDELEDFATKLDSKSPAKNLLLTP